MLETESEIATAEYVPPIRPLDVEELIRTRIPTLSRTNMKIPELLRDDNCPTRKIADAVGFDPVLTTRLLKMANSSLYARRNTANSIQQAIEALGRKSVYDIVMLGAMADSFAKEIVSSIYGRILWEHSIVVGLLAREVGRLLGLRGTEEAFLCGILHDIGKILLLKAETEYYNGIIAEPSERELLRAEEITFGLTHAEVGAYISYKWDLPEIVCNVILYHHQPEKTTGSSVVTHIVNVADLIANVNGYGVRLEEVEALAFSESVRLLRLETDQITEAWANIQDSLAEVLSMFYH
ncbi:MAG: HDOD domain-containing protein [Acidobacteria bacterium]|nr:HDOD domain-containing protein [Acidobacteriota bacterium]